MKTTLVNLRTCRHSCFERIDRMSKFGNPFHVGKDGTRAEVIDKYRKYFYKRIKNDIIFRWAVEDLRGLVLACWCSPLPCHGNVIIDYLEQENVPTG